MSVTCPADPDDIPAPRAMRLAAYSTRLLKNHGTPDSEMIMGRPPLSAATLSSEVVWVDLLNGTIDEVTFVEQATGRHVPTFEVCASPRHA